MLITSLALIFILRYVRRLKKEVNINNSETLNAQRNLDNPNVQESKLN
jgi:hypothetical protein